MRFGPVFGDKGGQRALSNYLSCPGDAMCGQGGCYYPISCESGVHTIEVTQCG